MDNFEPRIVGFCCNWCAYAGADLAGISRCQYPPNLRMIRLMCSGAVAPVYVLEAFQKGADGVFIGGVSPQGLSLPGRELQNVEEDFASQEAFAPVGSRAGAAKVGVGLRCRGAEVCRGSYRFHFRDQKARPESPEGGCL